MGSHGIVVCWSVCFSESAHLAATALRLQHGRIAFTQQVKVDVKASLSNKSEQKLRSLNSRWLATATYKSPPVSIDLYYSCQQPEG